MKFRQAAVLTLCVLCLPTHAFSASPTCTDEQYRAFDKRQTLARTWDDFHEVYEKYKGCDEGYVSEGVSDFVVHKLANRWNEFPELTRLVSGDPQFRTFVLKHIDATTDDNELKRVLSNAKRRCPSGQEHLCRAIARAALVARQEMTKSGPNDTAPRSEIDPGNGDFKS